MLILNLVHENPEKYVLGQNRGLSGFTSLRFALTVEPSYRAALEYRDRVEAVRAAGHPSLPSQLSLERQVNPFLRCDNPDVRGAAEKHAGRPLRDPAEVFGVLRAWKDQFR